MKRHVTGLADLGVASSFNPVTSTLVPSGTTASTDLYRNADGSYTRLEYPGAVNRRDATGAWVPIGTVATGSASGGLPAAGAGTRTAPGTLAFSGPSGVGVTGTHVTSASLEVLEAWTGQCPATATVNVSDASGHQVGRWAGKPPASACGSGAKGGWISVPVSGAGLRALSAQPGARLTVSATPAAASVPVTGERGRAVRHLVGDREPVRHRDGSGSRGDRWVHGERWAGGDRACHGWRHRAGQQHRAGCAHVARG